MATIDQIVKSLAFEVQAVPQDNTAEPTSPHSTPLNLKIKVKKKDECGMQHGILSVPKIGHPERAPERIRLISSDQTIMSFDVSMEADFVKKPKRKPRRTFFGGCLGLQYEDDDSTYLPSNLYNAKMADGNVSSKSDGVIKQHFTLSKTRHDKNEMQSHPRKPDILGKCKPGGCLDPPFGEEKYAYEPAQKFKPKITSINEETPVKGKLPKDVPILASPSTPKISTESIVIKKPKLKIEDNSILSLYEATSKDSAGSRDSDVVITYPPHISSKDKPLKTKAVSEEKQRKSFDESVDAFFSSPRKISRSSEKSENYKEFSKNGKYKKGDVAEMKMVSLEERNILRTKQIRPLSATITEIESKNSNDLMDSTINIEHGYQITQEYSDENLSLATRLYLKSKQSNNEVVNKPNYLQFDPASNDTQPLDASDIGVDNNIVSTDEKRLLDGYITENKVSDQSLYFQGTISATISNELNSASPKYDEKKDIFPQAEKSFTIKGNSSVILETQTDSVNTLISNRSSKEHVTKENILLDATNNQFNISSEAAKYDSQPHTSITTEKSAVDTKSLCDAETEKSSKKGFNQDINNKHSMERSSEVKDTEVVKRATNYYTAERKTSSISSQTQQSTKLRKPSTQSQNVLSKNENNFIDEFKINEALGFQKTDKVSDRVKDDFRISNVSTSKGGIESKAGDLKMPEHNFVHDNFGKHKTHDAVKVESHNENLELIAEKATQKITPSYLKEQAKATENGMLISSIHNSTNHVPLTSTPKNFAGSIDDKIISLGLKEPVDNNITYHDEKIYNESAPTPPLSQSTQPSMESVQSEEALTKSPNLKLQKSLDKDYKAFINNQCNTSIGSKSSLKKGIVSLDLAFQSFINDKKERTLKTIDTSKDVVRIPDDAITVIQSQLKSQVNKIRIPVDLENDMTIQIKRTKSPTQHVQIIDGESLFDAENSRLLRDYGCPNQGDGICHDHVTRESFDKIASAEMQKVLNTVYEQELIPLQNTIKHLKQEIDCIFGQQALLVDELCKAIKSKPVRLLRINPRCGCCRK